MFAGGVPALTSERYGDAFGQVKSLGIAGSTTASADEALTGRFWNAAIQYLMLAWRWYIELPIRSPLNESTREGEDHPARLFLRFVTNRGEKRLDARRGNGPVPIGCWRMSRGGT